MMEYALLFAYVLGLSLLINRQHLIISVVSFVFIIITAAQFSSLMITGRLIEPLALTNTDSINKIGIYPFVYFLAPLVFSLLVIVLAKCLFKRKLPSVLRAFLLVVIAFSSFSNNNPVGGLVHTAKVVYSEYQLRNDTSLSRHKIAKQLIKNKVYYKSTAEKYIDRDKYNVIALFIEGMSYDVISKEVTPNIYNMMTSALSVEGYFGHTAATFRGLRGQLTSSFQITGGFTEEQSGLGQMSNDEIDAKFKDDATYSLASILKKYNYQTYFQSPHADNNQLSAMLRLIDFDRVYSSDDLDDKSYSGPLSDKDSFSLLYDNVRQLAAPFFYGVYTFGTHLGLDSPDEKYGDGKNEYLNKFYNLDMQLGKFIEAFNRSALAKNTIIIFTSDHASYPTKEFKETFDIKNDYFVDRIPFVVYKQGQGAAKVNVAGVNSLSFSPTVLDILGIQNEENIFLGLSVFDQQTPSNINYTSAIGSDYLTTTEERIKILDDPQQIEEVKKLQQFGG